MLLLDIMGAHQVSFFLLAKRAVIFRLGAMLSSTYHYLHVTSSHARSRRNRMVRHKMDHLACFIPGMLALGGHAGAVTGDKATEFLEVAEELGETCWQMYDQMPTGARGAGPNVVIRVDSKPLRMSCVAALDQAGHTRASAGSAESMTCSGVHPSRLLL